MSTVDTVVIDGKTYMAIEGKTRYHVRTTRGTKIVWAEDAHAAHVKADKAGFIVSKVTPAPLEIEVS